MRASVILVVCAVVCVLCSSSFADGVRLHHTDADADVHGVRNSGIVKYTLFNDIDTDKQTSINDIDKQTSIND
eukprot:CAMPEP_0113853066 /NCGR_PEP_ID=MMETSP0372-20130328/6036_1 /TAXON_ID=340204 /ORGANISM="Lankesteria abbotti" /LENGTH=72 /DNA_ID=CAMNT_0000825039 /DNA_START=1 /DNA_END=216 /DNA_ORIENTATION=- /assembly_acc=CAM_ASM_000359